MRIEALIIATLAPLLASCGSGFGGNLGGCKPDQAPFVFAADLREADVDLRMRQRGLTREQLGCEDLCGAAYERDHKWVVGHAETCTHTLAPASSADPSAVVGHVRCAGVAYEHLCEGRRPLGHVEGVEGVEAGGALAVHLAHAARLEAASVVAFHELAGQLAMLGAPGPLVDRCRRAAAEEARHAAVLGGLAADMGGIVARPQRGPCEVSLRAIALHNATEGCVYEAWAAVRATWMAARAIDPALRAAYGPIAADEAGHAQLAWDLHVWLIAQLDGDARAAVHAAQRAALAGLPRLAAAQAAVDPAALGMPGDEGLAEAAARFAAGLAAAA